MEVLFTPQKQETSKNSASMYDRPTSGAAYVETISSKTLGARQQIVLSAIRKLQPCNDRMICDYLGWDAKHLTGRRNELMEFGMVELVCRMKDNLTGRLTKFYGVVESMNIDKDGQIKMF